MAGLLFLKRNVLRFDLKESREGFCRRRGSERYSFHEEGQKTEKVLEPRVGVRGISVEAERFRSRAEKTGGCVKIVEESQR